VGRLAGRPDKLRAVTRQLSCIPIRSAQLAGMSVAGQIFTKERAMKKILSLTTLGFAASLFLSLGAWAQQNTEDELSTPPPAATTVPAPAHDYEDQAPTAAANQQPASLAAEHSSHEQVAPSDQSAQESIPLATSKPAQQQTLISSRALVGTAVKNQQGEKVGDIRELMIDPESGRIVYAVMASGGVLGMGEKNLAVPWETFKVGLEKDELVVQIDKDKLQSGSSYEVSQR
jgi:sporulation protein YlmC with PRC-barrel domain